MQESIKVHARVQWAHAFSRLQGVHGLLNAFSLKRAAGIEMGSSLQPFSNAFSLGLVVIF